MDRLLTTGLGGFPYVLDDLRWVDDAVRRALSDIIQAADLPASHSVVLWGCEVTDGTTQWNVSAGALSFNGEPYFFPGGSIGKVGGTETFLVASSSFDPAGSKIFQDTSVQDTYQIRRAALFQGFPAVPNLRIVGTTNNIQPLTYWGNTVGRAPWRMMTNYQGFYIAGPEPLRFKKRGNTVELIGEISRNPGVSVGGVEVAAILPVGFRPLSEVWHAVRPATGAGVGWIVIMPNGEIIVRGDINPISVSVAQPVMLNFPFTTLS